MAEDFKVDKNTQQAVPENTTNNTNNSGEKVIDEANYRIHAPQEKGPTAIGRGGDPLFRRINASKEQLLELIEETGTVQDWIQREQSNNAALACLNNEDLKDVYFEIKDGFECADQKYCPISLMGFKTPSGVEIPRLKVYDADGEVLQVLTGPMAIDELNKRALAYKDSVKNYEALPEAEEATGEIADYVAENKTT